MPSLPRLPFSPSLPRLPGPSPLMRLLDPLVPMPIKRRLSIEGDTELGLMVKNLMDGQEAGVASGPLGTWLLRLDALVSRA